MPPSDWIGILEVGWGMPGESSWEDWSTSLSRPWGWHEAKALRSSGLPKGAPAPPLRPGHLALESYSTWVALPLRWMCLGALIAFVRDGINTS